MFENIDFKGGKITYDDFNIDFEKPFSKQIYSLKEDLMQVAYDEEYLIDLGWYPDLNPNGWFKLRVIKDYNWLKPISIKRCKSKKTLMKNFQEAVNLIYNLRHTKAQ